MKVRLMGGEQMVTNPHLRLASIQVHVSEIEPDSIGNKTLSVCMMDELGQFAPFRLDLDQPASVALLGYLLRAHWKTWGEMVGELVADPIAATKTEKPEGG